MKDNSSSLSIADGESETIDLMSGRRCENEVVGPCRGAEYPEAGEDQSIRELWVVSFFLSHRMSWLGS